MQETRSSLGQFFMLTGGLGALGSLAVYAGSGMGVIAVIGFIWGLLSVYNFWIGWNLARLLSERPNLPLRFAKLSAGLSLLIGIVSRYPGCILGLLLNLYIIAQLKRLAKEADVKLESQILE